MKKLVLSLIAIVGFALNGNAQKFDDFGVEHNRILKEILLKYNKEINSTNVFTKTQEIISSLVSEEEANKLYQFNDYSSPYLMLDELSKKGMVSSELFVKIKKDLDNTLSLTDYKSIEGYVNKVINSADKLSAEDKVKYLNFLSTLKHSAYFWDEKGGNGITLIPNSPDYNPTSFIERGPCQGSIINFTIKINYWKVLACDAVGCFFTTPAGGAAASCCSVIGQL